MKWAQLKSGQDYSIDMNTKWINSLLLMELQICTQNLFLNIVQGIYSTSLTFSIRKKIYRSYPKSQWF